MLLVLRLAAYPSAQWGRDFPCGRDCINGLLDFQIMALRFLI